MFKKTFVVVAIVGVGAATSAAPSYWSVTPAHSQYTSSTGSQPSDDGSAPQPPNASISLQAGTLPSGTKNAPYSFDLKTLTAVSGGTGSVSDVVYSLAAGVTLPGGLSLTPNGGLSGTPTTSTTGQVITFVGTYQGAIGQQTYTLKIADGPAKITLGAKILPTGNKGSPYNFDFKTATTITGGMGSIADATYSIKSGNIPSGLSLSSDGLLAGTPTLATDPAGQSFTVTGSYEGVNGQRGYFIKIGGATFKAKAISSGYYHSCAITPEGVAKCWGSNAQMGDGQDAGDKPRQVVGIEPGIKNFYTYANSCIITAGGAAKCWGSNDFGQLGDGTTTYRESPRQVVGLTSGVSAISLSGSSSHACVVVSGAAKCWGYNTTGQLGDGTATDRKSPRQVAGLTSGVTAISTGAYHTCAVVSGAAKCWGYNNNGRLGDGTTIDHSTPVQVVGLESGVIDISLGAMHACALTNAGSVKCWGEGIVGQIGDGTQLWSNATPMQVNGLTSGVTAISSGENHTCAIVTGGGVKCWGYNSMGQLGDGAMTNRMSPVQVSGLTSGVTAISSGLYHTCAIITGGDVKCWGYWSGGGSNIPLIISE